jgi:hypothetical protein
LDAAADRLTERAETLGNQVDQVIGKRVRDGQADSPFCVVRVACGGTDHGFGVSRIVAADGVCGIRAGADPPSDNYSDACKATVDMFALTMSDFVPQVDDIISVGEFYEEAGGGQIIFT